MTNDYEKTTSGASFCNHLFERTGGHIPGKVYWDYNKQLLTFPLYNLFEEFVGLQQYNWRGGKHKNNTRDGKYWTYLPKDKLSVWGLDTLFESSLLFLTEGIFDAISLKNLGYNTVAVLTNNPKNLKNLLFCLPYTTVAVCDGDKAGIKLASLCQYAITLPDGEDANSMEQHKLKQILQEWRNNENNHSKRTCSAYFRKGF